MLIENEFRVPAPIDHLWAYLLDVEKIAPCMPGAELTQVVDDSNWKGRMKMKFGPVAMAFAGTVTMVERDDDAHRVVLKAQGTESKGKGAASARVTSWLVPGMRDGDAESDGVATTVKMQADITLQGFVAQVSRGMLPDISARLTQQFADCLQASMTAAESGETNEGEPPDSAAPGADEGAAGAATATATGETAASNEAPAAPAKPVGGLSLGFWALFRAIGRLVGRILGKKYDD